MPSKIVYRTPQDASSFDIDRYLSNLNSYGNGGITREEAENALTEEGNYDPMHVSCLVEAGTKLIKDDKAAKDYYDDHSDWFSTVPNFERLRRITGYLVGTLSRWNDAKQAEEKARVKHGVGSYDNAHGQFSEEQKDEIERAKLENSVMAQF